ncbi:MAG: glycerate kinase [Blautia sp.]|nr:glycerate kinase [Blautia sp.]
MNHKLYQDAVQIAKKAVESVMPDAAVKKAVSNISFSGRLILVAVGKAAWQMAQAALQSIPYPVSGGIMITKYGHVPSKLPGIRCYEAGHPLPDENSFRATEAVLRMTENLTSEDTVLFLLSGGGSALFEKPLIPGGELLAVTDYMLKAGMDIREMNTVRKRLSLVKGGKFAAHCAPARIESVILSDIIGNALDMIASGPSAADSTSCEDAVAICQKYRIPLSEEARAAILQETPKELSHVTNRITGSVRQFCLAAAKAAEELGYAPVLLGDDFTCEAKDLGKFLAEKLLAEALQTENPQREPHPDNPQADSRQTDHLPFRQGRKIAYIAGGETVVHVSGTGLGGRNQELALTAGKYLSGQKNVAVLSIGSDGTDGPTDAAGGYADGDTLSSIAEHGLDIDALLADNDAYHGLEASGGLIFTGPTGTNVNDVALALFNDT